MKSIVSLSFSSASSSSQFPVMGALRRDAALSRPKVEEKDDAVVNLDILLTLP